MRAWLKKTATDLALKGFVKIFFSLACGGAALTKLVASWVYLKTAPWYYMSGVYVAIWLACVTALYYTIDFLSTSSSGVHTPRYLYWYANPLRKVSWDFNNFIGMSCGRGLPVTIHGFQASFTVNRGEISLKQCYLRSLGPIAFERQVLFSFGHSNMDAYVPAASCEAIPKGLTVRCHVPLDGLHADEFLQRLDGLELVFEYDNQRFRKKFSRSLLQSMSDSMYKYANPPMLPMPRFKRAA